MSCQSPVIATNVGGTPEIIHHEQNGFLFERQDHVTLSDLILRVLGDRELAEKVALNARETILSSFDWRLISREVESLYCKL
jgi:glycosyltransferase involved in cell wall biosynthesis